MMIGVDDRRDDDVFSFFKYLLFKHLRRIKSAQAIILINAPLFCPILKLRRSQEAYVILFFETKVFNIFITYLRKS